MSLAQTVFHLLTLCINNSEKKTHLFSLPICQEEIKKVIFAWNYELENNHNENEYENE